MASALLAGVTAGDEAGGELRGDQWALRVVPAQALLISACV
ncbi:hypothetical protein [Streptomyces sp. NPDC016845]